MSNVRAEVDRALSRNGYYIEFDDDVESPNGDGEIYIEASYGKLSASYRGTDGSFNIDNWKISPVRDRQMMNLTDILNIMSEFVSDNVINELHHRNEVMKKIESTERRRQRSGH